MKALLSAAALMLFMVAMGSAVLAQADKDDDDQDQAGLANALTTAKVTLESGLTASTTQGRPISGKFEMDEGKLQLSVYTERGGKFFEVVIDLEKGTVTKSEPITEKDDLAAAKIQSAAMAKAKRSLKVAVGKAVAANKGSRAVSVFPETKDGHVSATVTLLSGQDMKTVSEMLD